MFSYRQLRHTYGFGVHSPFAYRLVKEVVRPGRGYAWYGYEDIDAAVNSAKTGIRTERQAKMFHRLLSFLNPESLFLPLGIDPLFYTAAATSDSRMRIERKPKRLSGCRMIASHGDFIPLSDLKKHITTPGNSIAIMNIPTGWREEIYDSLPQGLMFFGKHNAIFINRDGMMKVAYSVSI